MSSAFRLLLLVELAAVAGNLILGLAACDLLVLGQKRGAEHLFFLFLGAHAPAVVMVVAAGSVIDRYGASRMLTWSGIAAACTAALLYPASAFPLLFFSLYALFEGCVQVSLSSRSSLLPLLVDRKDLLRGNALRYRLMLGTGIAGPTAMGWIVETLGPHGAFLLSALLWGAAALGGSRLRNSGRSLAKREGNKSRRSGKRGNPRLDPGVLHILGLLVVAAAGSASIQFGMPLWIGERSRHVVGLGILMSLFNLGALGGTFVASRLAGNTTFAWWSVSFLFQAAALGGLAKTGEIAQAGFGLFVLLGVGTGWQQVYLESKLQERSPPSLLGRIVSFSLGLRNSATIAAALAAREIVTSSGTGFLFLATAFLFVLAFLWAAGVTRLLFPAGLPVLWRQKTSGERPKRDRSLIPPFPRDGDPSGIPRTPDP